MTPGFHTLRVAAVQVETESAKTLVLEVPQPIKNQFAWRAGQHITLRFNLNQRELRRSYSISSSPFSNSPLQITVKRVQQGMVSNHIHDHVKAGSELDVMPPYGSFCLVPCARKHRTHYFIAAGSGITPLVSMLCSVLEAEPHSIAHLIYGNRDAESTLFLNLLSSLSNQFTDRLSVSHVFSRPSMFVAKNYWRKGKIDLSAIEQWIAEYPPRAQDTQYYVCGPGRMNQCVRTALTSIDVPANRIHSESFGGSANIDDTVRGIASSAEVTLNGVVRSVSISPNQTLLSAIRQAAATPPFSCEAGVCGACRASLRSGKVHMRARMALTDNEVDKGDILVCQSVALSEHLKLDFHD